MKIVCKECGKVVKTNEFYYEDIRCECGGKVNAITPKKAITFQCDCGHERYESIKGLREYYTNPNYRGYNGVSFEALLNGQIPCCRNPNYHRV